MKSAMIFLCLLSFAGCSNRQDSTGSTGQQIQQLVPGQKQRTAYLYEIPEGFTGWVLIEFGMSNCPPLSKKDGKLVIPIGSDGRYSTSSELEYGWAKDAYFFVGKSRCEIRD